MGDRLKNFGFLHKSGILMAVSSLPSRYGIGSFGKPCYEWLDFLAATDTKCWQILPLNPTAYGDSPYQSPSSFAGNPYFIDLQQLYEEGLVTAEELASAEDYSCLIDYGKLFSERFRLLRKAYERFVPDQSYAAFCDSNAYWLSDYCYYFVLKERHGYRPWSEWADCYKHYSEAMKRKEEFSQETDFWRFVQYEFFSQWDKVRAYAADLGIQIIGDMPIYVAYDSVEVWSKPELFLLDEELAPIKVAGCPPDGFSPDGQLWGNPIYNYPRMATDGYAWWTKRVAHSLRMYDIVRIDHFRGFAGFYSVPYGDATARNGKWEKGPGKELFAAINAALPHAKIIAEDLGFITEDVRELLDYCGYPGMKNLQFAFFDDDSDNLPRMYDTDNCVVYTGTHDADCTRSWCDGLSGDTLRRFLAECPNIEGEHKVFWLIRLAFLSKANLAMVPLQDWLLLKNETARMNVPSVAVGNWRWRVAPDYASQELIAAIKNITDETGRSK